MRVRDAVRKAAVTVDAATTLVGAAEAMDRSGVGTVLVTDAGRLVGIVTDRDVVVRGVARRLPLDARIDAVMSTALETLDADADLHDAVGVFAEHAVRRLPVLEGETVLGVGPPAPAATTRRWRSPVGQWTRAGVRASGAAKIV